MIQVYLEKNPKFINIGYKKMLESYFDSNIIYSDSFSSSFNALGQDAYEIIADFEILQKQWARENGVECVSESWMGEILLAQIKKLKPDIVYFQSIEWNIPGQLFSDRKSDNLIKILKEECPFIKKFIIYSGYPSDTDSIEGADIFFTSDPGIFKHYKGQGLKSMVMYHSFDERIIKKLDGTGKKHNFSFVGSSRAPESRYWALRQLLCETDLKVWIYDKPPHKTISIDPKYSIKQYVRSALKRGFQLFSDDRVNFLANSNSIHDKIRNIFLEIFREREKEGKEPLLDELFPERCNLPVMGMDMYNLLHQSKITFNKHADKSFGNVGNMRMFEATGVSTCLVTDTGYNMDDLFEPDKEIVTYSSTDEAVEKVNYLLNHPDEAEKIAKAGQTRTLKDHTTMNRCQQIDQAIKKLLLK